VLTAAAGLRNVRTYEGDYAPFAAIVAQSDLYVGYDSAGQHVAAAAGVPLVSVFAGYVSERMFSRWRPSGRGTVEVVKVGPGEPATTVLERTLDAVRSAAR
jgi:ADP-heptose:LPS heptosyltransferase